jgi:hypothetical protein
VCPPGRWPPSARSGLLEELLQAGADEVEEGADAVRQARAAEIEGVDLFLVASALETISQIMWRGRRLSSRLRPRISFVVNENWASARLRGTDRA